MLFAVCDRCGAVQELEAANIGRAVDKAVAPIAFRPSSLVGEVRGLCEACGGGEG